ncbi:MAG: phosphoribosylglycinamide formyltransferase, partial [Betaproteobacteria bacterium]|nr:phosphoribosylglycinamide formyltransferase [Betaproteobacteria bacterium]
MKQIVILISGRGSNMEALIRARDQGQLPANIAAVISNRPDAAGLATAAAAGIATSVLDHRSF